MASEHTAGEGLIEGVTLEWLLRWAMEQRPEGFGNWRLGTRWGQQRVSELQSEGYSESASQRAVVQFTYKEDGVAFKHGPRHYLETHQDDPKREEGPPTPMTTSDLAHGVVIPATAATQTAFCRDFIPAEHKGRVSHFVSHSWGMAFWDFVQALVRHQLKTPAVDEMNLEEITKAVSEIPFMERNYYWIDIFFKNQHYIETNEEALAAYLTNTIKGAGRVALIVDTLPRPSAFSRVWCLYEILIALDDQNADLEPCLSFGAGLVVYHNRSDEDFAKQVVAAIDVTQSEATKATDKAMIDHIIEQKIGAEEMTRLLRGQVQPSLERLMVNMTRLWGEA